MTAAPTDPVVLADVMAGDWELQIEREGQHYTAVVTKIHNDEPSYRSVLNDSPEDAIDGGYLFIAGHSPSTARSLRELAVVEVARKTAAK